MTIENPDSNPSLSPPAVESASDQSPPPSPTRARLGQRILDGLARWFMQTDTYADWYRDHLGNLVLDQAVRLEGGVDAGAVKADDDVAVNVDDRDAPLT